MLANLYTGAGTGTGGYGSQVNVRFKNLHNILKGKYISYSYFNMVKESKSGTPKFSIYPIMEDWNYYTTNWNNKPSVSDKSVYDMNITYDSDTIQPWLTNWVRKLSSGEINNDYGIAFYPQENSEYFYLWFYGLSATNSADGSGRKPTLIVNYKDVEDINAVYDGTFQIEGSYDDENKKIELSWESYNDDIDWYDLYIRKNDNNHFEYAGCTAETNISYDVGVGIETYDFRVVAVNEGQIAQYGEYDTQYLSNICSFKKDVDETIQSDESNSIVEVYNLNVKDTDGDGLEDGYEIWDFKTLWNTETGTDEEGNKIYNLDTDNDGFPDSYEVFTLGTNPAVANEEDMDSDEDGWSDLIEYQQGTDPYLKDSDFDGNSDKSDPYPRYTSGNTRISLANQAEVYQGLYEVTRRVIDGDKICEYIVNIYSEQIKQAKFTDCSTNEIVTKQYYYDTKRNNTAIIEKYSVDSSQTTCTTYTYNNDKQIIFVCSKNTRYSLDYKDEELSSFRVGNGEIIKHTKKCLLDNEEIINNLQNGETININQEITEYSNGQKIKNIITEYKVETGNKLAKTLEVYFDDSNTVSYRAEYDTDGNLTKFFDYTVSDEALVSIGNKENGILTVCRNDGFIKEQSEISDDDGNQTSEILYTFKNITNIETQYSYKVEIGLDNDGKLTNTTLYNQDIVHTESSAEEGKSCNTLYSKIYDRIILNTQREDKENKTSYNIDIYAEEKNIDYVYDNNGNIIKCSVNGKLTNEYSYDIKNRLIGEKEYHTKKYYEYVYDLDGNLSACYDYNMTSEGKKISNTSNVVYLEYGNSTWNGQITKYNGNEIKYDNVGNPVTYKNGEILRWERGNKLAFWKKDNENIYYKYNENGLRTVKDTSALNCKYEWDGSRLIREKVTYKATDTTYDIWYFYDGMNDIVGYEYSYINANGELSKNRIYYEKDLQGNVIALLDSRGAEIAIYNYDAWGNILNTYCYEGNETAYNLNNIKYRSYYHDNDTGFYYLQNRYYDSETGRFLNSDNPEMINENVIDFYCYCDNNPVMYIDPSGMSGSYVFTIKEFYNESRAIRDTLNIYFLYIRTKVIEFKNEKQFIENWNRIKEADTIVINSHASYLGLGTAFKYIVDSGTVKKLKKIKCKALIVLGCEAGDYTKIWRNIAYNLSSKINGIVVASDGPVTSGGIYVINPKFTSIINKRHKWGWILYKSGKVYDTWYSTNLVEITMPQILSYLKKCKLISF